MSVKGRREEYKELTRAALLEAATERFAQDGYPATTIDDIASLARVSKGAVYYHFADKAQLFEAAFRERQQQLLTKVAEAAGRRNDPWDQLDAALAAYLEYTVADPTHRALLQQAPQAIGADRCREIDEQLGLPVLLAAAVIVLVPSVFPLPHHHHLEWWWRPVIAVIGVGLAATFYSFSRMSTGLEDQR